MKQKLRLTITRIRRQLTSNGGVIRDEADIQIINNSDRPALPPTITSLDMENPILAQPVNHRVIPEAQERDPDDAECL